MITMKDVMTANCAIPHAEMLTSNHCAALARELNKMLAAPAEHVRAVADEPVGYRVRFFKEPEPGDIQMKILIILLAFLPCVSYAGDCEKLAAFQQNQERKLQSTYMTMYVKRADWIDFLRASDRILKERYDQRVALCKQESGK